jgi:general secretion pathway protein L
MLAEFLSWWCAQLAALVAPLHGPDRPPDALLLRLDPAGEPIASRRRKGQETSLGHSLPPRARGEAVILVVPGRLLVREVALPLAAERSLDSLLGYEIDRLTPFSATDVVWSHRVLARDHAKGRLRVELALLPRSAVAPLLAALPIAPDGLEAAGPDGAVRRLSLAVPDPGRRAARRRREAWAMAVCAVVVIALIALPFLRQSLALADIEASIAALRPQVDHAEALRQRLIAGGAGSGRLAAARAESGSALHALSALTDLLPDDTWLTSLGLRKGQVSIEGHSAEATRLIATLAADPRLRNPGFIAPVVRAEDGSDIFSIRAELTP